jgi:NAD(P)-dependent dehydrogenase (short-subunit alcohol dehydrogenase family)
LVSVDVTDTGQIEAAVNKASELGPLRLLVNSAGIGSAQRTIGKDGHVAAFDGQITLVLCRAGSVAAHRDAPT